MIKKFFIITFTLLSVAVASYAFESDNGRSVLYTQSLSDNIHSVQIENYAKSPYYPMFELGSNEFVTLKFDDLNPEINTYGYKIIHCNSKWQPDDMSESQYIDGFTGSYIEYEQSINTFVPYTHYKLTFPNEEASPTISGNYIIFVYNTEEPEKAVLTARFMVVESHVALKCSITGKTDIDVEKTHQQVNITIDYPEYEINQPASELKLIVTQNNRLDNVVTVEAPSFYERHSINYKMNQNLIFDAGNEFRTFDISSKYVLDHNVKSFEYFEPFYHVTLFPSAIKAGGPYESWQTVSGRYIINYQDATTDPDLEADYAFVHFSLPVENPFLDGKVYIMGELTGYKFNKASQMDYNYESGAYEKVLFLKQGGYNFLYAYLPNHHSTASMAPLEGDFWQTLNEYAVYVYYKPFGSLYERLIGYWVGNLK